MGELVTAEGIAVAGLLPRQFPYMISAGYPPWISNNMMSDDFSHPADPEQPRGPATETGASRVTGQSFLRISCSDFRTRRRLLTHSS